MIRRQWLRAAAATVAASVLGGCRFSFEQGLFNECRTPGAHRVLRSRLVQAAWDGVDPALVWDCHAHLFGNGRSGLGNHLGFGMGLASPLTDYVRRTMFLNAACAGEDDERLDLAVAERIALLADALPAGAKIMLLAFDFAHDPDGTRRDDLTAFAVPDAFAARVARTRPDRFEWIASIHPYRVDAQKALESARTAGARAVKWLPQAMNIDLSHARSLAFYGALRRAGLPLLVHVGEEQAVAGAAQHLLGNPLALRHALDAGVRVIAAHCASLGESPDLDVQADPSRAPQARNFHLFARLMGEARYANLLYGDLSAVTQVNRAETVPEIIAARHWHARLLNGSDYPLPAIMPIYSIRDFVRSGMLEESAATVLRELRHVNPLLFDFVLKRSLSWRGARLPAEVFESRPFFDAAARRA